MALRTIGYDAGKGGMDIKKEAVVEPSQDLALSISKQSPLPDLGDVVVRPVITRGLSSLGILCLVSQCIRPSHRGQGRSFGHLFVVFLVHYIYIYVQRNCLEVVGNLLGAETAADGLEGAASGAAAAALFKG